MDIRFDSYMILEKDLYEGQFRLLEVDNRLILPTNVNIKFIITSSDVLHSFAVPSLGVKLDASPGRLNQVAINILREGVYYGQCSELCGINHGFMPIVIEAVHPGYFSKYVCNAYSNMYYDDLFFSTFKEYKKIVPYKDPLLGTIRTAKRVLDYFLI
jgi:heme/copper-type cytochrome/quinol oxidase subunit 2